MAYNNDDEHNHPLDDIEEQEEEEKKPHKFNIFSHLYDDGKGVDKDEEIIADNPSLKNFFIMFGRKLNTIFTLNLMMIAGNFPIFFAFFVLAGYLSYHTSSPYYTMAAVINSIQRFDHSAAVSALSTIFCREASVTVLSTADKVLLGISALAVVTFGPVRCGVTYIMRNMMRGEPIFMWDDFKHAVTRNLKQGLIYGILDVVICAILAYDIIFFNLNYDANLMVNVMFFMSLALAVMYFMMRMYIYLMIVTFDMTIFKMFKNALYFTVLGVKRNCMALLGVIVIAVLEYVVLSVFFPLGVILPFIIIPAAMVLISVYAAFPKVKEIMIDPYYTKTKAHLEEEN